MWVGKQVASCEASLVEAAMRTVRVARIVNHTSTSMFNVGAFNLIHNAGLYSWLHSRDLKPFI